MQENWDKEAAHFGNAMCNSDYKQFSPSAHDEVLGFQWRLCTSEKILTHFHHWMLFDCINLGLNKIVWIKSPWIGRVIHANISGGLTLIISVFGILCPGAATHLAFTKGCLLCHAAGMGKEVNGSVAATLHCLRLLFFFPLIFLSKFSLTLTSLSAWSSVMFIVSLS